MLTTTTPIAEREPLASLVLYHLFKWTLVNPLLSVYFRGRIHGVENVPHRGAFVLVSNHASYFDPLLLSSAVRRPVAYMAKEELFQVPLLSQGMRLYGAYPVKRGKGDLSAIRAALDALKQGWATGIFLGGTRTPNALITAPKLGATLIAAKAKVPLLPVSLWGTEKILVKGSYYPHPVPVTIRVGELLAPPESTKREELERITENLAAAIARLYSLGR